MASPNQWHESIAHLVQYGIETRAAHARFVLVEQSVVRLARAGKRLGAFANEREQPIERRREQLISVLRARLFPCAQRLRFRIGKLTHQILGQRQRMAPQTPEQRELAR